MQQGTQVSTHKQHSTAQHTTTKKTQPRVSLLVGQQVKTAFIICLRTSAAPSPFSQAAIPSSPPSLPQPKPNNTQPMCSPARVNTPSWCWLPLLLLPAAAPCCCPCCLLLLPAAGAAAPLPKCVGLPGQSSVAELA